LANTKEGLGVDRIDIGNGRRTAEEQPDEEAVRYLVDENGRVRLKVRMLETGSGMLSGSRVYMYRTKDPVKWKRLEDVVVDGTSTGDFRPIAVESARDAVYGSVSRNGYDVLAQVALDGTCLAARSCCRATTSMPTS